MKSKKSGAVKGLVAFIGAMVALTFFSRTLYYATLPKVETQRVSGGVLRHEISGTNYLLDSQLMERVEIPISLGDFKITVEQVHIQKYAQVKAGDMLISFDPVQCADAHSKADEAYHRAEEALLAWDIKFRDACSKLDMDIMAQRKKMLEENADLNALDAGLKVMQDEKVTLERARMLDGVARAEKEQAVAAARSVLDALTSLAKDSWALRAQSDYIVSDVYTKSGNEYAGLLPLIKYIPDDAKLLVGIECESKVEIIGSDYVTVTNEGGARSGSAQWVFAGESTVDGKRVLWAEPDKDLPDLGTLSGLTFRIDSDYYQYLVPNSAVVGNAVFVLDNRYGAWGAEELFARRVEIRPTMSDDKNTAVPTGVTGMDSVIVRWDRPFYDGDVVVTRLD